MHAEILRFERACDRAVWLLRSPSFRGISGLLHNVRFSPHCAANLSDSIGLETDRTDSPSPMPDRCIPLDPLVGVFGPEATSCRWDIEMYPLFARSGICRGKT